MTRNFYRVAAGAVVLLSAPAVAVAQQPATITGTVTAEGGSPLGSAQVFLQGMSLGTQTGPDGRYTITVPAARATGQQATVVARRLGFRQSEATVTLAAGASITQDFTLSSAPTQLEGIVVTALGIEREKKALGVAQQQVSGEAIARTREPNLVAALSGKVAGATITNTGTQGGSSRIVLRGASSLTGNNQPLFIVDGIPVDNSNISNDTQRRGYGGYDYGNAIADINPNDIESVSVLKGANAAALYGARAANGAIVITTKRGAGVGGIGVAAHANVTFETPLRLPDYQNSYGQGSGGEFAYVDGAGGGVNDGWDASWGPKLDGRLIPQFNSPIDPTTGERIPTPWVANPGNVENFFETGRSATVGLELTGSTDRASFRLSATNQDIDGMVPNSSFRKVSTALAGTANLTERLSADASVQYVKNGATNRPGTGYDAVNPMMEFVWFGRQVDVGALRDYVDEEGNQLNWNHNYHNNPYWLAYQNGQGDTRDRIIGMASVSYKFADWLSGTFRAGTDYYREERGANIASGTIGGILGGDYMQGGFFDQNLFNRETNFDVLLTGQRELSEDFDLNFTLGSNFRTSAYSSSFIGTDQLVVPGTYNIDNSAIPPTVSQYRERKQVNGAFGSFGVGYRDYLFVDVTGRNDWSSTLPEDNNSYFYPSVSTSFIFTEAVPALSFGGALGYGKVRAGWTRVGNDAPAYQLFPVYSANTPFGSIPRYAVPNSLLNPDLKPEQIDSWEVGTELQFLDNRLALDLTYYNKTATNQIIPAQISPSSGYTSTVVNAGKLVNNGVEAQLSATPVRGDDFQWDFTVNFAQNRSEVKELFGDVKTILLGPTHWGVSIEARLGERYGAIYGNPYLRDDQGNLILDDGLPQADPQKEVLGHYTPDWTGGLNNHFRYGNWDLDVLFDMQQGGSLYSVTHMFGLYAGVLEESVRGREVSWNDPGLVVEGVNDDGSPNTTNVTAEDYWGSLYGIHEAHVFDASWIKLRELRLGYRVPSEYSSRIGVSQMNVSLVGRNLWLGTDVPHIDPETGYSASNLQGFEFGQLPTARSFGIQVNVTP
ncbi:MAG TPA: SusC/RagA family TonB-linked outer membrane protein [Gemmatimonadales bacterium]